jgi:hypothetical protein
VQEIPSIFGIQLSADLDSTPFSGGKMDKRGVMNRLGGERLKELH